jgi:hypothetical protein
MASKNTPVWKGSREMQEDPESPINGNNKDGATQTRIFNGPYATLASAIPARLSNVIGSPLTLYVDTTELKKQPGGNGKLTINLSANPFPDPGQDVQELEWVEIQKPLLQHPRYQPGGVRALTDTDLDQIEEWKNATTATLRASTYARLTANAADYVDKIKRGEESFVLYAPVVRVTQKTPSMPACGGCGKISTPTEGQPSAEYVYLKTADRRMRQDRNWSRVQEWTGAQSIDTDIYSS